MPLCGFNKKMIDGLAIFSQGLFEATIERGNQNGVDAISAVHTEVEEIAVFISHLRERYGVTVDTPKKMAEMIHGIAVFAGALFEATLTENNQSDSTLKDTFDRQVQMISDFLEKVENKHQELKRVNTPEETMRRAVEWIDQNDKGASRNPARSEPLVAV